MKRWWLQIVLVVWFAISLLALFWILHSSRESCRKAIADLEACGEVFLLYSVGMDGIDPGGLPNAAPDAKFKKSFTSRMDAVWPRADKP